VTEKDFLFLLDVCDCGWRWAVAAYHAVWGYITYWTEEEPERFK